MTPTWQRSSYSGNQGNCVEVKRTLAAFRDSKNVDVEMPVGSVDNVRMLMQFVKTGRFTTPPTS